ncbi:MAG: hypothetical protein AAF609_02605 [Cyanobacteria bacterium P01_C01_bin.120]
MPTLTPHHIQPLSHLRTDLAYPQPLHYLLDPQPLTGQQSSMGRENPDFVLEE